MIEFHTIKLNNNILNQWIDAELNVCLIGKHGSGKSTMIINAFNARSLNWKYFSGATLDPWTDIVGIPTVGMDGIAKVIDYILPKSMSEDLEAIVVDEFNRCPKVVRNALLELIQFKSINGRKFPKLKFVWAAINPETVDDELASYDVERIDAAQLDRFHVIVKLQDSPDKMYFMKKFGENGQAAVDWWAEQPKEVQNFLSARRLEYTLNAFQSGLDIKHLLPVKANTATLARVLAEDVDVRAFNTFLKAKDFRGLGAFLSDINKFDRFKKDVPDFAMLKFVNKEILDRYAAESPIFRTFLDKKGSYIFGFTSNATGINIADVNTADVNITDDTILAEQISDYKNRYISKYTPSLSKFTSHYAWASQKTTFSKQKLYSTAWSVLNLIPADAVAAGKLRELLILLGQCHKTTLLNKSKFPELQVFCFFAKNILKLHGFSDVDTHSGLYKNIYPFLQGHAVQ